MKQHVDVKYISSLEVEANREEKLYCKLKHMQSVVVLSLETARCCLNISNISNYTDSETPHCFYLDYNVLIICTLSQNQFRDAYFYKRTDPTRKIVMYLISTNLTKSLNVKARLDSGQVIYCIGNMLYMYNFRTLDRPHPRNIGTL